MTTFRARRHRLELPPMPNTDDPAQLKRAMDQMKRLVQDEFNRLSTDFYDFKKATFEAAILPLRGVANIAVTKTQYSMSATWELPDGNDPVPTEVRIRIPEVSDTWATYTYPKTSFGFSGLLPNTQYTLQIQLRSVFETTDTFVSSTRNCPSVPVLRIAESPIRTKVFTTDTGVGPPTDNGTNDDQVIFVFPDTEGTPGTAGGSDCYWGYKFQYRTACAWADTAVSEVEADGDVGDVTIDTGNVPFSTYPNTLFRLAYREICNAVPQDWVYGEPFMAVDFSDADCLGIVKSASLSTDPFDTANVFALPGVCQDDGTFLQIVDAINDVEFVQGSGLKCVEYIDNEWTLIGKDTGAAGAGPAWQPMISGEIPAVGNYNDVSDFTLGFEIKVPSAFNTSGAPATSYPIVEIGGKIKAYFIGRADEYDMMIEVPRDGGGAYTFRAEDLAYGEWNNIYYVHDVSEADGRILYANGTEVARSANAIENDFQDITSEVIINTIPDMNFRSCYFFDFAVSAETIDSINQLYQGYAYSTQPTPSPAAPAVNVAVGDVVFITSVYRDIGTGSPGTPSLSGTSTMSSLQTIVGANELRFDSLGVSDGRAWVYASVCTTAGTLFVTGTCVAWVVVPGLETAGATDVTQAYATVTNTVSEGDGNISATPGAATGGGYRLLSFLVGGGDGAATTYGYLSPLGPLADPAPTITLGPFGWHRSTFQWSIPGGYTHYTGVWAQSGAYSTNAQVWNLGAYTFTSGGLAVCQIELVED